MPREDVPLSDQSAMALCLCCDEPTNVPEDEIGPWEAALCPSCAGSLASDEEGRDA